MGDIVLSKTAAVVYLVVTAVIITSVGLMAGLINKNDAADGKASDVTTASPDDVTTTQLPVPGPWKSIRLPGDLVPSLYGVDLKPMLEGDEDGRFWFDGDSSVVFEVVTSTNYIYLHSVDIAYNSLLLQDDLGADVEIVGYELYEPYQYLIIEVGIELEVGRNYTLLTTFTAELSDGLGGLYRSSYTDDTGVQRILATSQMQPTDARKAFPCFDEPALKAQFDIKLWHKDPNFAISNMPNVSTEDMGDGWKRTSFERTFTMSTYLLAFVVCDFSFVEGFTTDGITAKIYARSDQVENGNANYARDITPSILDFYQQYFSVPYPLPKSDQLAVPDFNAGAMENWGLVIYRETALLYDAAINSASNKQRVASVIAHELAHQWFGNLITPLWWDELWLNEGFASFLEYKGTDHVEPTWKMDDQFLVGDFQRALGVDGLTSSHPIVQKVETPAEINEVFDTISYSKGACLIRMINKLAGDSPFKQGLTNYINSHKYGSVTHQELLQAWEDAIEADTSGGSAPLPSNGFQDAMSTWTLQMGFPLVSVKRVSDDRVVISQRRFLIDQNADPQEPPSEFKYKWDVPFWYKTQSSTDEDRFVWLLRDQDEVEITVASDEWIVGNSGAVGYYRVNYDVTDWTRITQQLNDDLTQIEASNRGQLLNDAFTLARIGQLQYGVALELAQYLRNETEYIPWESGADSLAYFELVLSRSKVFGLYSKYLLDLVNNLYNSLGWNEDPNDTILVQYNRINAVQISCEYGNEDCVKEAKDRFDQWTTSGVNTISPNLRTQVYCNAVRWGGVEEWDFIFDKYLTESNSQEKGKLEDGLTCSREPWINQRFIEQYITNDTFVRKQDASSLIEVLCMNDYARDIVWDYLRQNWDFIYDTYGSGSFSFSGIIESCTAYFSTPFELKELEQFKADNLDKLGSGERALDQAFEQTQTNIEWRSNYEEEVFVWMKDNVQA